RLKGREMWRPLAPSVLAERFGDFFAGTPNPHMLVATRVRPEMARAIPAVVHVDGTARPQSVARAANPLFHRLIAEFERVAGVPMVLNTSLNVAGQPIALT